MTSVDELLLQLFRAPRVLVLESADAPVEALLRRDYDCAVDSTADPAVASHLLRNQLYDLVLVDLSLKEAVEPVLKMAQSACPDTPVVAMKDPAATVDNLLPPAGSLTLLSEPVSSTAVKHLFRVFKIKARTQEMAAYCQQQLPVQTTVAAD